MKLEGGDNHKSREDIKNMYLIYIWLILLGESTAEKWPLLAAVNPEAIKNGPLTLINGKLSPVAIEERRVNWDSTRKSYPRVNNPNPKIHMTRLPIENNFLPPKEVPIAAHSEPPPDRLPARIDRNDIVLDTKYFSLAHPDIKRGSSTATPGPEKSPTTRRAFSSFENPNIVLRKVKGRLKTTTTATTSTDTSSSVRKSSCNDHSGFKCNKDLSTNTSSFSRSNENGEEQQQAEPKYKYIKDSFRDEIWVLPVLASASCLLLIICCFEVYLLVKSVNRNPSRRHLFLGQMLLLGLMACTAIAAVFTLKPTSVTCAVIRMGSGLSYSVVYSTLLVKLVFLVSLNSGVYLPATYQSLLLCFAVLIQLVIGVQWLVTAPPNVVFNQTLVTAGEDAAVLTSTCLTQFRQQLFGLLYVVFLILVVVLLAFKARGVRENYREAVYVGLTMGFTVAIWIVWILAGLIAPVQHKVKSMICTRMNKGT